MNVALSACDWLGSVLRPSVSYSSLWPHSDDDITFILMMEDPHVHPCQEDESSWRNRNTIRTSQTNNDIRLVGSMSSKSWSFTKGLVLFNYIVIQSLRLISKVS
ncbi:unnamed protein product [Sphenostylis stenocarpa]|uniref:Uncharacterized protein n=1 Tax=Sphenostylis stenocarpa TaxID=92480 RepID=A0AA86S8R2_9FABA|nr:unnamed protein product [Sphenostylis stenocarpa]